MTDEWRAYSGLSREFKHGVVNHGRKEYVKGDIHLSSIENFWSLLKRGIYHYVSPKHLHRYCDEFQFRYNTRKSQDTQRFIALLSDCEGRLTYTNLIS